MIRDKHEKNVDKQKTKQKQGRWKEEKKEEEEKNNCCVVVVVHFLLVLLEMPQSLYLLPADP